MTDERREYNRQWWKAHPEKLQEKKRRYREKHREYLREKKRLWHLTPKGQETRHKWEMANAEKMRAYRKKWTDANPEKMRGCRRAWLKANPEKRRQYEHRYYSTDQELIKHRLYISLKRFVAGKGRSESMAALVGCSSSELRQRLESLFSSGMTWTNYGTCWVIDHRIPCSRFDLTDPEQQRKCFHWSNLQPLWDIDNAKKGAKVSA